MANYPCNPFLSGALYISALLLKKRVCSLQSIFFYLRVDHIAKTDKYETGRVASSGNTTIHLNYRISSVKRQSFFLPKQSQKSRSVLRDGSRSLGLLRKGKTCIIAKLQSTDLLFVVILEGG